MPTRFRNIYNQTGHCYCIDSACAGDPNDDDYSCCGEPNDWHWDPDFLSELMDSCRPPFFATQSIMWSRTAASAWGILDGIGQYNWGSYFNYSLYSCLYHMGEDISATDVFPEYWWEPGMDLSSGNYPLTPHDFMSFDQCGRWVHAGQPPVPLDDTNVPNENCSDLTCWEITGNPGEQETLHFDECGCCSSTHENTDLSENCRYF